MVSIGHGRGAGRRAWSAASARELLLVAYAARLYIARSIDLEYHDLDPRAGIHLK